MFRLSGNLQLRHLQLPSVSWVMIPTALPLNKPEGEGGNSIQADHDKALGGCLSYQLAVKT